MRVSSCAFLLLASASFGTQVIAAPPADSIEYAIADTNLRVTLEAILEECPANGSLPKVRGTLTLLPVPKVVARHRISGRGLSSFLQKRELALSLYENGTLKSINAAASDRTAAIIGNVLKLGANLVPLTGMGAMTFDGAPIPAEPSECTDEINELVHQKTLYKRQIKDLRSALALAQDAEEIEALQKAITGFASLIADLDEKNLKLSLSQDIAPPEPGVAVNVEWEDSKFARWFKYSAGYGRKFALPFKFELSPGYSRQPDDSAPQCAATGCPYLVLREPVQASVSVNPAAGSVWSQSPPKGGKAEVWVSQWGGLSYYPLRVGLFRSRSLKLELDPFGRRTQIGLNSEATGEAITGGLLGISDAAVAYHNATSDTKQMQTWVNEMKALQEYNKYKRCEEILEQGGFTCPS